MKVKQAWATPLTAGAFFLVAVTGVLMFFHLDSGLNKTAHEWLSWVLLIGASLHIASNFRAFKGHFRTHWGRYFMGGFALVLALTFIPVGRSGPPPIAQPAVALAQVPLATFAQVAGLTTEQLLQQLSVEGFAGVTEMQTLAELESDFGERLELMSKLLNLSND